ncbi:hypothetical protein LOOC260_114630 [Paucilactobacillus hokkaidonensis JCM 18461]|uniref:Monooxygenase n=2 Tax=Paucilactobacillus hokkaidonensis TaxID=1193095 RepID=A0A0A1GYI4_9LACO|nr:hypothetical protein [Paucilactobacillus hokkaidonensis]KRO07329.1 hypothetical protein IV59_GL001891 [Paucilactobacillus hokkaidonensis]BAP85999.1 hypothetical protein LOOC260_114630 [Paucilactobacillus hokkaidonensis JCM 18461]
MLKQISATFGSEEVLTKIVEQNPNRQFKFLQTTPQDTQLQLLDISGEPTIFKTPIEYQVLGHAGNNEFNGLFHFEFLKLDVDNQKVWQSAVNHDVLNNTLPEGMLSAYLLENKLHTNENVLLTTWISTNNLANWTDSLAFQNISMFNDGQSHYYQQNYSIVK